MLCQRSGFLSAAAGRLGDRMRSRMGEFKAESVGRMLSWKPGDRDRERRENRELDDHRDKRKNGLATGEGLEQVARLASQDSGVQRRVNEILEQSDHHHS